MIFLTGGGAFSKAFSDQYRCEVIDLRLIKFSDLLKGISAGETIIHNAANINCKSVIDGVNDNFILTKKLLDSIYEFNPNIHFILLSSMSILDNKNENKYRDVNEMTPYAYSKYLAETYCLKHPHINVSIVRFSTFFYADDKRDGLSKLISDTCLLNEVTIYNNGKAYRDFMPLRIAAQYVYKIINSKNKEKIYNIASAQATSFFDIIKYLKSKFPSIKVINKELSFSEEVLSDFSDFSINKLGRINFELENEIDKYIKKLKGNHNN